MKYLFSAAAFAAGALAAYSNGTTNGTVYYTTEVVTALTTFCPSATELTYNGVTYPVTEATTLTITNCPCTLTHTNTPVPAPSTVLYTVCPSSTGPAPSPTLKTIVPPPVCPGSPGCPLKPNALTAVYTSGTKTTITTAIGTGSVTGPYATFTNAASSHHAAGIFAAVGAVAALAL
ncbi:hypothetical protein BP6252_04356 [Coleophoma cylindrospora]|uniref:Clock-controlled protein 6 n=1 Tax=Coleophoma cylindrospora TaxID=1849047 RepID=A0A3D8S0B7_9HELO|nr:hypothetical protein BP6252_04356 [Coleophoma cylindrospora]